MVAEIEANVGPIDVLINNAGYGSEGVIEETPFDEVRRQFEINLFGPIALIQAILPFMRPRRSIHPQHHLHGRLHHHPGPGLLPWLEVRP